MHDVQSALNAIETAREPIAEYRCDHCRSNTTVVTSHRRIILAPATLVVHVKRFDQNAKKNRARVNINRTLDLRVVQRRPC
jgi:ubiquitin C-terminal hydrolase